MRIVEATLADLEPFFVYLGVQLLDNASDDSPLFQPIAKKHCQVSKQLEDKFRNGFESKIGQPGWRKLWLVKDNDARILGHIDLRHDNGEYSFHRVTLGMGVDSSVRKQGLGRKLVESVIQFCHENTNIDWLDLNVLANNRPAKELYLKCGFQVIGEMSDCYRIDGQPVSEITMTLCTRSQF
ncbi:GNAT family N-acetyltransferase [Vibrio tapetis subsp. quintayensis]|uniref:GNAT family N-acetyltransferase n=1 Tax=Vibrio tapetis TaxID=52443 RepID=UPI0025B3F9E7|nr:GNAT family N-acetyltransferase [Vibrio tapetis]MDN3679285.1 GNAT family N-acetyltransferase [Vibrio tapetis subsp. quintayensis]